MVDHLLRVQYGLVTRQQALDSGVSRRQIDTLRGSGQWIVERRGVYRHSAVAISWESKVLGACLSSGGIVSHRAASALWGLELFRHPDPEVVVGHHVRGQLPGIRVHQTTQWHLRDETVRHRIPVTGIDRTLLDCGAVVSVRTLERLAESAIRQRHTTWKRLAVGLMRHSRKGRDGCGTLRALLQARLGDHTMPLSDFSRLIYNLLVDSGVPAPELEYRISDSDGAFIMQADLAWPSKKKVWELDGLAYHFGRSERERDNRKRNRAKAEGWNIQEILWSMYVDDPDGLVASCRKFLAV